MGPCSKQERPVRYRRRSHEAAGQVVRRQRLKSATGFENQGRALLAAKIETAVGVNRRSSVLAADPFRPNRLSGFCINASQETLRGSGVYKIIDENRRRIFADV